MKELRVLGLNYCRISGASLAGCSALGNLDSLSIKGVQVSPRNLSLLRTLTKLRSLTFSPVAGNRIVTIIEELPGGLRNFSTQYEKPVPEEFFEVLASLKSLEAIFAASCHVTPEQMNAFGRISKASIIHDDT